MSNLDYKRQMTRVIRAHGRFVVQVSLIGDGEWVPVAIRENCEVAEAISADVLRALQTHTDDLFDTLRALSSMRASAKSAGVRA